MDPSKYARSRPPKQLAGLTHQKLSSVVVSRTTGAQGIAVVVRPASDSGTYTFTVLAVSKSGAKPKFVWMSWRMFGSVSMVDSS